MAINRGLSGINLLPRDRFENSSLGKFLGWATTSGRVLVVMTEFVVLLAFGSRFYFDKKLNDVSEIIDQKQSQIEAYADTERRMRNILTRQSLIKSYMENNIDLGKKYEILSRLVPYGVSLDKLSIDSTTVNISGESRSELGFAQFLTSLKNEKEIAFINIQDTIFDQTSNTIKFSIRMNFR